MHAQAWHWRSVWTLPVLAAAMDAAWIAPYTLLLGAAWMRPGAALLAPSSVWALLIAAQALTRTIVERQASARTGPVARPQLPLAVTGAAAACAAVAAQYGGDPWWRTHGTWWHAADLALTQLRPELPALIVGLLVWRRGIGIGRTALEYFNIEGVFYLGLVMFGLFAAGTAFGRGEPAIAATAGGALPYLIAFFASSLIALPVARLQTIRRQTQASPQAVALGGDWYVLIAGAVAALLGAALLAAALLRLNIAAALAAAGRGMEPLLWLALYVIAVPLGFIISGLIWLLRRMMHPRAAGQPPHPPGVPRWLQDAQQHGPAALPPAAAAALRWGVTAFIAALIVLWLARAVFRYERVARSPAAEETHESVWSWADLRAAMAAWLKRGSRQVGGPGPRFGTGTAAAVRRAYAELLGLAASLGAPRAKSQTPDEFAGHLGAVWPRTGREVRHLTAVYDRVRYGVASPSDAEVAAVRGSLARIRIIVEDISVPARTRPYGTDDRGPLRRPFGGRGRGTRPDPERKN